MTTKKNEAKTNFMVYISVLKSEGRKLIELTLLSDECAAAFEIKIDFREKGSARLSRALYFIMSFKMKSKDLNL